jgi:translation initiation factor 2B subunit (eIF-2B alpha/beta/delta family)
MKNIKQIFKENSHLLNEPEVQELVDYCRDLEAELIEYRQEKTFSREDVFKEMVREINEGCDEILDSKELDYKKMVENLRKYIKIIINEYNIRF